MRACEVRLATLFSSENAPISVNVPQREETTFFPTTAEDSTA
jgi:hypothetical protein